MFESGQSWKTAALKTSKCVCFFYLINLNNNVSRETLKIIFVIEVYVSRETLEVNMYEYYMKIAIKEANKAFKINEVPVGAVIVKNKKIIAKAYNKREKTKNVINHAEIIAITKACKNIKNWRLDDCEIYITMEPCMMCSGAIQQSRIKKIIYGVKNE